VIQYVFVQNYNIRYTMWLLKEYRKWRPNKEDQLIWERCPKEGICKWDNKFVNAKLIVSEVTNYNSNNNKNNSSVLPHRLSNISINMNNTLRGVIECVLIYTLTYARK
jgi:hypothetical protein